MIYIIYGYYMVKISLYSESEGQELSFPVLGFNIESILDELSSIDVKVFYL